jgi:hypothetical protein
MSPAEKQAREEQADRKSGEAAGKRYNALSSVEQSKDPRDDVRGQKGYKKGGMVKKRRYFEGGETDEMEMANNSAESQAISDEAESAGARARGQAMLEEMRDKAAQKRVARPAAKTFARKDDNYSNEGRGRAMSPEQRFEFEDARARSPEGVARRKKMEQDQALERVTPETALLPGGGLKGLGQLAKNLATPKSSASGLAGRAALKKTAEEGIERNLASEFQDLTSAAARNTAKKNLTSERSRDLASGQAKTKFTSAPKATNKNPAKRTKKFDDAESNVEFKRGGSTSSRGDGIAQRGKTRGKMC